MTSSQRSRPLPIVLAMLLGLGGGLALSGPLASFLPDDWASQTARLTGQLRNPFAA
jgi:hypothetical protein